ncbi:MAG: hypothetical protein V1804_02550 [Patescibacteria group bacterium]
MINYKEVILDLLDVKKTSEKETNKFSSFSHDELCELFYEAIKFKLLKRGINISNEQNIHGWRDKGIDIIFEAINGNKCRVGIQVKGFNDIDGNLDAQINNTLANYDSFGLNYVIIIFCGDCSDKSHKSKIKMQIVKIQEKDSREKFIIVDPLKALTILEEINPIKPYINQFKKIIEEFGKIDFEITNVEDNEDGFPAITIKFNSIVGINNSKDIVKLIQAYLSNIIGLIFPEKFVYIPRSVKEAFIKAKIRNFSISLVEWYFLGLEEHGPIAFWGSDFYNKGNEFKLYIQFRVTKTEFEKRGHYKVLGGKFIGIANALLDMGKIEIN